MRPPERCTPTTPLQHTPTPAPRLDRPRWHLLPDGELQDRARPLSPHLLSHAASGPRPSPQAQAPKCWKPLPLPTSISSPSAHSLTAVGVMKMYMRTRAAAAAANRAARDELMIAKHAWLAAAGEAAARRAGAGCASLQGPELLWPIRVLRAHHGRVRLPALLFHANRLATAQLLEIPAAQTAAQQPPGIRGPKREGGGPKQGSR